jgi:hypothetical protein
MADTKISALTASTTPLAGTEVLPIVQSGTTKQVSVANLTTGRAISATQLTLTTGNLIVANGQGIDFSATPGTGTSELLADYEEGTWTPTFTFGTAGDLTIVYSSQVGRYTKIGRTVHVEMTLATSTFTHTTASGNATINGLPFIIGGTDATTLTGACGGYVNATFPILGMQFFPTVASIFLTRGGPGAGAAATFLDFPTAGNLYITFQATYIV